MLHPALNLATPLKMLDGLETGRLRMHARDYRQLAIGLRARLEDLSTEELIDLARHGRGALAELAERVVFDRSCSLVRGSERQRSAAEVEFESLMNRLLDAAR